MAWGYSFMALLFITFSLLHSRLIVSLHHKSQLLKAEYDIDWSSIDYQVPSLKALTSGQAFSNLSFDIVINNPTEYDIAIEDSQIRLFQRDQLISSIDINGFALASGQNKRIKIKLDSNSDLSKVSNFGDLLNNWRADLSLQVWPGIPLIVNLIADDEPE